MYLAAIFGGVFGLAVVWLIHYIYEMKESKEEKAENARHAAEIDRIKQEYKKNDRRRI